MTNQCVLGQLVNQPSPPISTLSASICPHPNQKPEHAKKDCIPLTICPACSRCRVHVNVEPARSPQNMLESSSARYRERAMKEGASRWVGHHISGKLLKDRLDVGPSNNMRIKVTQKKYYEIMANQCALVQLVNQPFSSKYFTHHPHQITHPHQKSFVPISTRNPNTQKITAFS